MTALLGFAIAALLWWGLKAFGRADAKTIARLPKLAGGAGALAVGGLLMLRGQLEAAILVGGVGAWLLGWAADPLAWLRARSPRQQSTVARLRSAMIEMELDSGSGRMSGTVLAGPQAGRRLDDLGGRELLDLRSACLRGDLDGVRLIEPYLDRRFPGWREDAEPDPDGRRRSDPKRGAMTEQEAYEVLGLQPGAKTDAVRGAHRSLMKKLHPDQGGSTYLASRVNQAKDVLLNRHR